MKRLLSITLILWSFIASANVDFQFNLGNFQSDHLIGRAVLVTPLTLTNTPGSVPSKDPISYTTTNTGYFWISNVVSGTYQFEIQAPPRKTTYKFYIRGGTGVVIADSGLITETNSTDAQTVAYTIAGANATFVQNLGLASEVTATNSPTASYALGTPDGTNLAWILSAGGSGQTNIALSGVTNANYLTNWTAIPPNAKWDTNGNDAGAGGFLGTTNATDLRFKSWGTNWLTIRSTGTIIAGPGNDSFGVRSVILSPFGGNTNSSATNSTIVGGQGNIISNANKSIIVGGSTNYINGGWIPLQAEPIIGSIIGAGEFNVIMQNSGASGIFAGSQNMIGPHADNGFIGSGTLNTILQGADFTFIGSGRYNVNQGDSDAAIVGGRGNFVSGESAFIGAGETNTASGRAVVGGGHENLASGDSSVVVGGGINIASGEVSAIGGGSNNVASGLAATVAGGASNTASGTYSFAAGRNAQATNDGAFVWADSQSSPFGSGNSNTFSVRAQGGAHFNANVDATTGKAFFGNGYGLTNLALASVTNLTSLTNSVVFTNDTRPLNLNNPANTFAGGFVGTGSGITNLNAWGTNYIIASTLPGIRLDSSLNLGGGHNDWAPLQAALDRYTNGKPIVLALDGVAQINQTLIIHSNTTLLSLNKAGGLWLTNNSNCTMLQNDLNTNMASPNIAIIGVTFSGNRNHQACFTNGDTVYGGAGGGYYQPQGPLIMGMWFAGVTNLLIRDVTMFDAGVFSLLCNDSRFLTFENVRVVATVPPVCGGDGLHFYGGCSDIFIKNYISQGGYDDQLAFNASEKIEAYRAPFWNTNANTISNIVVDGYICSDLQSGFPLRLMDYSGLTAGNGHVYDVLLKNLRILNASELADDWPQQSPGASFVIDGLQATFNGGGDSGSYIANPIGCSNFVAKNIFVTQVATGVPAFDTRGCSNVVLSSMIINVTGGAAGDTLIDSDGTFQTANKPSQNVLLSDIIFNGGGNVIGGNANKTLASNVRATGGATFNSGSKANVFGGDGTNGFVANPFIGNAAGLTNLPAAALPAFSGVVQTAAGSATTTFGTFTSATLGTAVSDETGSGALVFGTSPTVGGVLTASKITATNYTGTGALYIKPSGANALSFTNGSESIIRNDGAVLFSVDTNGNVIATSITASMDAGNLTGSIADARLSANVSLLNAKNVFSASNFFTAPISAPSVTVTGASPGTITLNDASSILRLQAGPSDNLSLSNTATAMTVVLTNGGAIFGSNVAAANFYGNGANVTALNAANVASGTLPFARAGGFTNHNDMVITSLATANIIAWDSAQNKWTNGPPAGGTGTVTPTTITQTNFVLNTVYTNGSQAAQVKSKAVLHVNAVASGVVEMDLMVDQSGGTTFTKADVCAVDTTVLSIVMDYTNCTLISDLSPSATYYFTNASVGTGNTGSLFPGTGQSMTVSSGTNGAVGATGATGAQGPAGSAAGAVETFSAVVTSSGYSSTSSRWFYPIGFAGDSSQSLSWNCGRAGTMTNVHVAWLNTSTSYASTTNIFLVAATNSAISANNLVDTPLNLVWLGGNGLLTNSGTGSAHVGVDTQIGFRGTNTIGSISSKGFTISWDMIWD